MPTRETSKSMENMKHSMIGAPGNISSDKDIIDFVSIGLNSIIESVCNIYEESDAESDAESEQWV